MGEKDVFDRLFYNAQIDRAVGLIVSAADEIVGRTEAGRLHAACLDVDKRIGLLMEKVSATERRKGVKKDDNT